MTATEEACDLLEGLLLANPAMPAQRKNDGGRREADREKEAADPARGVDHSIHGKQGEVGEPEPDEAGQCALRDLHGPEPPLKVFQLCLEMGRNGQVDIGGVSVSGRCQGIRHSKWES